jgi:EAL domain-containing protein (putative c-di-GMP-specific phosphodiesterase class I)
MMTLGGAGMSAIGLIRLLVVDDDPAVLQVTVKGLERHGFETETARNGREAMDRLHRGAFDVVLSDINMPGYGGLDFLRSVRERDLDVPVILMTGKPTLESSHRAIEYGAFRYLTKPVLPSALADLVRKAARLHEVARLKRQALELLGADGKLLGDRAGLEACFGKALNGLWMAFQPIVSWGSKRVYGYEALMRSTEPTLASPGALLDAAERLGKLRELSRTVRARAAILPPDGALLFVNLHALDLNDEDLYKPDSALARIADRVVLEITERASFNGVSELGPRIARLRDMGFKIAVDDLGAGYAGLASFAQLDPQIAKLDMSLIRDIPTQPKSRALSVRCRGSARSSTSSSCLKGWRRLPSATCCSSLGAMSSRATCSGGRSRNLPRLSGDSVTRGIRVGRGAQMRKPTPTGRRHSRWRRRAAPPSLAPARERSARRPTRQAHAPGRSGRRP